MSDSNSQNGLLAEVAQRMSEKLGRTVEIKSSSALGGGCINHASKIETNVGSFFLKWNADCAPDIFLREAESLDALNGAAAGTLAIPKVIASKEVGETPGFLVLEYLRPGTSNSQHQEQLGRGLASIHQLTNRQFGFAHNNYCGATLQNNGFTHSWADFFAHNRLEYLLGLIQNERPLPATEMKVYERLIKKIPDLVPQNPTPVLIHGDLWSGNFMICETGPALIDPASYFADREMEFAIITMFGGFSQRFYAGYNEANPLPADWRERNPLYQLYHVLNHYYLFGGGYRSQALHIANSYL